jgi:hypothetical protein
MTPTLKGRGYRWRTKVEATEDGQRSRLQRMVKGRGYRWAKVGATDGQRSRLQRMVKGRGYRWSKVETTAISS